MATTAISAEYLAGLFDGEGCIDVQRMYPKEGKGRFYVRPRVRICMSNSARGVIYKLYASFGGHITTRAASKPKQQTANNHLDAVEGVQT
jgi:LAGLIDADG endonuclease